MLSFAIKHYDVCKSGFFCKKNLNELNSRGVSVCGRYRLQLKVKTFAKKIQMQDLNTRGGGVMDAGL